MKTCNRGHRHDGKYCKECHRAQCAARYRINREKVLATAKEERTEYKFLKAQAQQTSSNSTQITEIGK